MYQTLDKFHVADFKYYNSFLKFQSKKQLNKAFLSQIKTLLFFQEILQLVKFKSVGFKYGNSFLNFQPKFLIPRLGILVLREILSLEKFECVDIKYENSFSELKLKTPK